MQRLDKLINSLIRQADETGSKDSITFENLGTVFQRLGVFQNIVFHKDDSLNQTTLTLNHGKVKPERLNAEVSNRLNQPMN